MEKKVEYSIDDFLEVYGIENDSVKYISPILDNRICRYCKTDDNKKFKNKAHLLPEYMGNDTLFADDECDDCNKIFAKYETCLNAYGGIKNIIVPIKGKKGYPKFKDNNEKYSMQHVDGKLINKIEIDNGNFKVEDGLLKVDSKTQSFIPLYVYKALVKFAISFIKTEELYKFKDTIEWLLNPDMQIVDENVPKLYMICNEIRPPVVKPIAFLCKKKKEFNSPEYTFVLFQAFNSFQVFLHFNSDDKNLDFNDLKLPLCPLAFYSEKDNKVRFKHFDMNYLTKNKIHETFNLNFRPKE